MSAEIEVVLGERRYVWTLGSHVAVFDVHRAMSEPPVAMITVPGWINRTQADRETLLAIAMLYGRGWVSPVQPGDLVERIGYDLDPREVVSVGRDFLTLDILGSESPRLPRDNYRVIVPADGALT